MLSPLEGCTSIRTLLSSTWKMLLASSYPSSLLSIFQNKTNLCNKCKLQSFFNYNHQKVGEMKITIKTRLQTALKISRDYQRIFPLNLWLISFCSICSTTVTDALHNVHATHTNGCGKTVKTIQKSGPDGENTP